MKICNTSIRRQEFMKAPIMHSHLNYQVQLLNEQANLLISKWPKYNMHDMLKCHLPEHPCTSQVLELPLELRISKVDQGNSPTLRRLSTTNLEKVRTPLELLLGQRPQWECLEEVRTPIKELHLQYAEVRNAYKDSMGQLEVPVGADIPAYLQYFQRLMTMLAEYKDVISNEVTLIAQYLLSTPKTPVCLYGITPDIDALPHFFPVVYPLAQEPKDAEEYVEICDKLKTWRAVHANNINFMDQMFEGLQVDTCTGLVSAEVVKDALDSIKAIYEQWSMHRKKLIGYCNELLKCSILSCRILTKKKQKAKIVERDIAEQLLESHIHHNRVLPEGWLVTVEYCLELAKARYDQGRDTVFSHAAHS